MTQIALPSAARPAWRPAAVLFPVVVFASAALVFLVEPLVGRLILPRLGGGSGVWNTSLAFFQGALLVGYLYAHLLQRISSAQLQSRVHLGVLLLAGAALPLRLSGVFGDPPPGDPTPWLLGELALTIGAPFAALSATAPLLQAWSARREDAGGEGRVYGLYAASNLGSLLALAAYPFAVEPHLTLATQRLAWTAGYGGFVLLAALLSTMAPATGAPSAGAGAVTSAHARSGAGDWAARLRWMLLAAAPSSLTLGVTTHLASDVGSFPFLWVIPLGLYLLTFVIAFREGARRPGPMLLGAQAVALVACVLLLALPAVSWPLQLAANLSAFFLTAWVCHAALVAHRPGPERLTEFYLLISLGGVLGGAFNALLAPVLFDRVWEYPLVLVLAALARPTETAGLARAERWVLAAGLAGAAGAGAMVASGWLSTAPLVLCGAGATAAAVLLRGHARAFTLALAGVALVSQGAASGGGDDGLSRRSFFGVHRVSTTTAPGLGRVRRLAHGSTLHGAEALDPARRCVPMTYYAPGGPIADAFAETAARHGAGAGAKIGAVGLGAGSVAALTRPGQHLTFYEIDPAVVRIARDDGLFAFVGPCAKARIDYVLGDGRLRLAAAPAGRFDMLLVDAFSSDSVPTHLLTTEALAVYLRAVKADGVVVLHLSNRNLDLLDAAASTARAAGATARVRVTVVPLSQAPAVTSSTAMVLARSPQALAAFTAARGWRAPAPTAVRPWTDDYTNVPAALLARLRSPE